jgi:hypothetical protein
VHLSHNVEKMTEFVVKCGIICRYEKNVVFLRRKMYKKMKRMLAVALCALLLMPVWAVNYCASSSWGYGSGATGGGNATPTLVKSVSELKSALNKGKNKFSLCYKYIGKIGDLLWQAT